MTQGFVARLGLSAVLCHTVYFNTRVTQCIIIQYFQRTVYGAIVYTNNLNIPQSLIKQGIQALDNIMLGIIDSNKN